MTTLGTKKVESLYCLFKGEPGTRKSTSALSFPKPQYWFSIDKKMDALRIPAKNWNVNLTDIEYDDYSDYMEMPKKLAQLQMNCKYKTIIIDSITSNADMINRHTISFKSGATRKSGQSAEFKIAGISVNTIEDYKAENSAFQEIIAVTKDIKSYHNVNVILIAHIMNEKLANSDKQIARIIVTGGKAISAKFPAYCEEVYHFDTEPNIDMTKARSYIIQTQHTGDDFARTQLPLEPKIQFNDRQLYNEYLKPGMDKLNG